jgi:hypothetical protein
MLTGIGRITAVIGGGIRVCQQQQSLHGATCHLCEYSRSVLLG